MMNMKYSDRDSIKVNVLWSELGNGGSLVQIYF